MADAGVHVTIELRRLAGVALACSVALVQPALAQAQSTWFLAEGADNATFAEEILVGNPGDQPLDVTVTLLPQADASAPILTRTFALPATARLTVRLGEDFGFEGVASALVSAVVQGTALPRDIVVERTMTFKGAAALGSHNASGVPAGNLATTWILAEGSNSPAGQAAFGFDTFVLVANPNPTSTEVRATYLTATGASFTTTQVAPRNSRVTFWPRAEHAALASAAFSTVIQSLTAGNRVVAERAMYFDDFRSGHDALGVPAPSTTWYFAEGFTGGSSAAAFETFLLLVNPGTTATVVTVDYLLDSGEVISLNYPLASRQRFTVWVDQEGRTMDARLMAAAFGIRITAPVAIVAERAMYWGTPSAADPSTPTVPWVEGHATAGITAPAARWAFAEGQQGQFGPSATRFDSFFLLANPQPSPIAVKATFVREDGTGIVRTVCVPPNARTNIWTAVHPELDGQRFAAFLESTSTADPACPAASGAPFVAERALYAGAGFQAGHVNTGTAWTGVVAAPRPIGSCALRLASTTQGLGAAAQSLSTDLTANCGWTATSDAPWLILEGPATGTTNATIGYRVLANPASTSRTGRLTFAGGGTAVQLTVTQAGTSASVCALAFTPATRIVGNTAVDGVTALTGECSWTLTSNAPWLTVGSPLAGSGSSNVAYSVAAHTGTTSRTGIITVSGGAATATFTVTQLPACRYTLAPTAQNIAAGSSSVQFTVTSNRAGCTYTATAQNVWLTVTNGGSGGDTGTIQVAAGANDSTSPRTGRVRVSWPGGDADFTVNQAAGSVPVVANFVLRGPNGVIPNGAQFNAANPEFRLLTLESTSTGGSAIVGYEWSQPEGLGRLNADQVNEATNSWSINCLSEEEFKDAGGTPGGNVQFQLTVRLRVSASDGTTRDRAQSWIGFINQCGS